MEVNAIKMQIVQPLRTHFYRIRNRDVLTKEGANLNAAKVQMAVLQLTHIAKR